MPLFTSIFFTFTLPNVLGIIVVNKLNDVLLPDPLGPNKPKISPF